MSVYWPGSSKESHLPPSTNSSIPLGLVCLFNKPGFPIFITFTVTNILLLIPLAMPIYYLGLQHWRQQRSSSMTAGHSDTFTYHLVTMELINIFGGVLCCWGIYKNTLPLVTVWLCLFCFAWYGETFFHMVTCVEHYLAVVHPITYMSLRQEKGIRIRNIIVGSIWLFTSMAAFLNTLKLSTTYMDICLIGLSVVVISFCSLSVLWALLHPGPGEQGRDQRRLTQSKQRAFYTLLIILGALMVRCISNIAWSMFSIFEGTIVECSWLVAEVWCNLPSSLVLPLLFLHRAGKLTCRKFDNKSEGQK